MSTGIPVPPADLHKRVAGALSDPQNYEANGRAAREAILDLLPPDWQWEGKRVLDFGCGPGRVLRQFLPEAERAELHGCDTYLPGIEWLRDHVPDHVHVFANAELPPLELPDSYFDLIWAVSVFTHLTDSWSRWLLELHRLLDEDGLLLATFHGQRDYEKFEIYEDPWCEDRIGMNVLVPGTSWEEGGPAVFHSRWWLEAHWGRAFDVMETRASGFGGLTQGVVLLRKRNVDLQPQDLERPEPGEPRELEAVRHNVRQLSQEIVFLHRERDHFRALAETFRTSRSWRVTRPMRALATVANKLRRGSAAD